MDHRIHMRIGGRSGRWDVDDDAPVGPCPFCARAEDTRRCSECGGAACAACLLTFEEQVDDFFLEIRLCPVCRKAAASA